MKRMFFMTKRLLIILGSVLLALIVILLLPVQAPDPGIPTVSTVPTTSTTLRPTTRPTTIPTVPTTIPTQPTTVPTVPTTTLPPPPGQVRLYICDGDLLEKYMLLAVEYYQRTGTEVILLTPQEGESCEEALAAYMASDAPPTVFCLHSQQTLQQYQDRLWDLTGTSIAENLANPGFGLYQDDKLLAVPVAVDWFGYVFNAENLGQAGFSRVDLTDYSAMQYIADYITSQKNTLGVHPFGQPDLAATGEHDLTALLTTVFSDPDQLRSFIDLYAGNSRTTVNALTSFQNGTTVFYAGTTACFDKALTLGYDKLELLPAFADGSDAMHYFCEDFLAVTNSAYAPDTAETLAFLGWLVTGSDTNAAPIDDLGLLSPYKAAAVAENALEGLLREYMATEPVKLVWPQNSLVSGENYGKLCEALTAYYKNPTDSNWSKVEAYLL